MVTSAGTVKVGASVSTTVINCESVVVFPQSSTKVQVLVIVPVPLQPVKSNISE